ncbi:MAG: CPBP family intramembrane metalloprotease [Methanotrichaceae archaeon]|nr:CPBP family intramembrane metalloprotease [Methanotrichaceae archaeon]
MTILGAAIFFAIFPQYFDLSPKLLMNLTNQALQTNWIKTFNPLMLALLGTLEAIAISPFINGSFAFGEEFGWRAYSLPKLLPLGGRKAILIMGIIWGVWHWPVIAMGHNYGFYYPGAPWTVMLAMIWFTVIVETFLGWVTLRSRSVWPAVIGHAAINGISGLPLLFVQAQPNLLLGPAPTGLIASLAWTILALGLFLSPKALAAPSQKKR